MLIAHVIILQHGYMQISIALGTITIYGYEIRYYDTFQSSKYNVFKFVKVV